MIALGFMRNFHCGFSQFYMIEQRNVFLFNSQNCISSAIIAASTPGHSFKYFQNIFLNKLLLNCCFCVYHFQGQDNWPLIMVAGLTVV